MIRDVLRECRGSVPVQIWRTRLLIVNYRPACKIYRFAELLSCKPFISNNCTDTWSSLFSNLHSPHKVKKRDQEHIAFPPQSTGLLQATYKTGSCQISSIINNHFIALEPEIESPCLGTNALPTLINNESSSFEWGQGMRCNTFI